MVLFGPDISHYQTGFNITRAADEGCSFIIGKISQGSGMRDTQWPTTRDQARRVGLPVAGYHYIDGSKPASQAANCAAWIGDRTIPVALDWETGGGGYTQLAACTAAFRDAGLTVKLVYTGEWYWRQQGCPNLTRLGAALWKSRYPSTRPGTPADLYARVPTNYWAGLGGVDTTLLQFADHASIAGMQVDCSAFNGSRTDLDSLFGRTSEGDVRLPTLREGDGVKGAPSGRGLYHWAVTTLQAALNLRGLGVPPLAVDGCFGPETTAAVKALQARSGLPQTGVCDDATWPWAIWNEAPDYV